MEKKGESRDAYIVYGNYNGGFKHDRRMSQQNAMGSLN